MVSKFYLAHGFPQWLGAVDGSHVSLRNEYIRIFSKIVVEWENPVPICILGDPAYSLLPFLMKEFVNVGSNEKEQFFWFQTFICTYDH